MKNMRKALLLVSALVLSVSAVRSAEAVTRAQCHSRCQVNYQNCLAGPTNPIYCEDAYVDCIDWCDYGQP